MGRWLAQILLLLVIVLSVSAEAFALEVTTQELATVVVGVPYLGGLTATGGRQPYTWSINNNVTLPISGLTFNSDGTITGQTDTAAGPYGISFKVTDLDGTSAYSNTLILRSADPLTITNQALAYGYVGSTYYRVALPTGNLPDSIMVSGGTGAREISYTGTLPAELSMSSLGTISGTPSEAGESNLTFSVTDQSVPPMIATRKLSIRIYEKVAIATTTLPGALQKAAYSAVLSGGGGVAPYSWKVKSGSLPAGLALNGADGLRFLHVLCNDDGIFASSGKCGQSTVDLERHLLRRLPN